MVSNFQINTNDPNITYLKRPVNSNEDLFELIRKSARKAVTGIDFSPKNTFREITYKKTIILTSESNLFFFIRTLLKN